MATSGRATIYIGDGKDSVGSATATDDVTSFSSSSTTTNSNSSSASDAIAFPGKAQFPGRTDNGSREVTFPGKAVRVVQGNVNGNVKSSADVEAVESLVASISTQSSSSEGVR